VGLKLIFLVVTRAVSVLGLSRRESWWKDFCNSHRPHRTLDQAAPLRSLPGGVTDLDHFRVRRHDRVGGVIHEYRLVA
jgi:hypothetical protein